MQSLILRLHTTKRWTLFGLALVFTTMMAMRWFSGPGVVAAANAADLCVYAVAPVQANVVGHQAGSATINVVTLFNCNWTTVSHANWISVISGINQNGSGQAQLSIQVNPSEAPRTGTVTVAGKTITINQAAWTCSYALSSSSANVAAGGSNGTTQVITPNHCPWTASSNVS
jgi:hypothetical protein